MSTTISGSSYDCKPSMGVDLINGDNNIQINGNDTHGSATDYISMEVIGNELSDMENTNNLKNNNDGNISHIVTSRQHVKNINDDDDMDDISTSSTVMTVEGIHDYPGFYCVCLVILIGDMNRGVMFPTLWPLVESLGGTKVSLGYSVAAFSFGRVLVNPVFGYMSDTIGYTITLFVSCTILFIGTLLYAQVENIGSTQFLIFAQMIIGIGSGTLGVTRAFVAEVTDRRNRTKYMALITAVQYGGFTVTPAFGALFIKLLGDNNYTALGGLLRLNMYTAPAYLMSTITLSTIIIMSIYFQDRHRIHIPSNGDKTKKTIRQQSVEDHANSVTRCFNLTIYDCCILGCMLLNVATKGSIACFETLGIAIAQEYFDMLASRAGIIVACCGTLGVISLLMMGELEQRFTDVKIICGGIIVMILGVVTLTGVEDDVVNPTWQYMSSMFLIYSIGYPIGHTAVIGLFSKIIGRQPQGLLLGWFASAGSLARIFFPIASGYIAHYKNIDTLFGILTGILFLSTVFVLLSRKTLNLLSS